MFQIQSGFPVQQNFVSYFPTFSCTTELCKLLSDIHFCDFLYYGEWLVVCEFVCELLMLSCSFLHAENDVALLRITVLEFFFFGSN